MTRTRILASISLAVVLALLPAALTFADGPVTDDAIFRVSITDFLTLTIDETNNTAHITPQNRFSSGSVVASVATNNGAGYTLSIVDADERNGLERAGYSIVSAEEKPLYNIASVTADTTYANLTDDSWGYFLGSTNPTEATYKQIPLESTEISSSDSPTASTESTTVSFGVKTAATRPSGTYEDTVVFSAVATPLPLDACVPTATTISEAVCMQDMNSNVMDSMVTETQYQLRDNRDDKMYWIAKLADGKVWMTQNLDLDLETTPDHVLALTSENTDLNEFGSNGYDTSNGYSEDANGVITWTPERNTIPTSSISSTGSIYGWSNDTDDPYSIDTGDWYWIGNWKNNGADTWYKSSRNNYLDIDNSGAGDKFSTSEYAGNGKHGHVGNYYNWTATIASNDSTNYNTSTVTDITTNPQNSICPAGWRLPTISNEGDVEGSTSEFRRLVGLYGNTTGNDRVLTASPMWFIRSGNVTGSSLNNSGYGGLYWSSTVYNNNYAYYMYFLSDGVISAHYSGYRDLGWSVRCVAR